MDRFQKESAESSFSRDGIHDATRKKCELHHDGKYARQIMESHRALFVAPVNDWYEVGSVRNKGVCAYIAPGRNYANQLSIPPSLPSSGTRPF